MPSIEGDRGLLEGDGVNVALQLEVVEAIADDPPSEHHVQDLLHRTAALVFELVIDREGQFGLGNL